jgi:flagellar motor switch protein FliG
MAKKKLDPQKLTGPEKAAVFLLRMGEEYATAIFKQMTDDEIRRAASAMAEIETVPAEVLDAVMEQFVTDFQDQSRLVVKGDAFLKNVIGKSLDREKAQAMFREIENRKRDLPFVWSRDVDAAALAGHIQGEHPQTIAMILSHLPPEIASEVLTAMPDEKKGDIAIRIAQLGQVPEDIVRDVDDTLRLELGKRSGSGVEVGGIPALVQILSQVDKSTEDIVMESIEEEHSDIANDIRGMMFVFEDLIRVDDRGMREILKKVESQQLVLALKTASEEMKQKILGNLSSRASEMLMEDLEVMGPVRLSEVEEAQQNVISAAKELEAEGTIVLGGKGKEDILV